jgi:hypothetical protein
LQGFNQKAADKGLRLKFNPIPDDGSRHIAPVYHINLDNDHVREIIDNLTENAIKYTPAGEVVVDISGTEDKVVVSIKDSGIGIPNEDMPHLFQKFYRVDNVDTREIGGTGLGLYLCRRLAETMGGRIWAESEYKKGSTFYLELPRISSQEAAEVTEQQAQAAQAAAIQATIQAATGPSTFGSDQATALITPTPATPTEGAQPSTTVPRGESLTPEQIAAHVAQLKAMIKEQQSSDTPNAVPTPVAPSAIPNMPPTAERSPGVTIPQRNMTQPPQ